MARHKDANWNLHDRIQTWDEAQVSVLMDTRDELQKLNRLLHCHNFIDIPHKLERIKKNTVKPRKKRKVKK